MGALSFKDWLTEQQKKQPSDEEREQKKQEWLNALEALYGQLHAWVRQDDPQEIMKIWRASETIEEEELGFYQAPSLRFVLHHHLVAAKPVARNVIGPGRGGSLPYIKGEGRVDLTDGVRKWHLYRVRGTENQHRWVIVAQDQLTFKDLDKATFEDALQRLFS